MARISPRRTGRLKGATVVLLAALMPVVIGGLALSVDTAVTATARAQLSTVADAAALAGARKLATDGRRKGLSLSSADIGTAQAETIAAAGRNKVLGASALLLPNASNTNNKSADVVVGYVAKPTEPDAPVLNSNAHMLIANTVLVTARRDSTHAGVVPAFFSKFWGNDGSKINVTSAAAVLGVTGYKDIDGSTSANVLPIVLDKATYAKMMKKETLDLYSYNPTTKAVTPGPDGITESKLYPVGAGYPGNWGTIKVGVNNNSTATLGLQIRYGVPPSQMKSLNGGPIQLSPTTGTVQFGGNPGISAGIKDDLKSIIGKPVRIPIYDPAMSGGNGNNLVYTVVAFAPAVIVNVIFKGVHSYVTIQPAKPPLDPTTVWGGVGDGALPVDFRLVLIR